MTLIDDVADYWFKRKGRGPRPQVTLPKVFLALNIISRLGPIGRYRISSIIGVGEGVSKSLIKRFSERNLIAIKLGMGCSITWKGVRALSDFMRSRGIKVLKEVKAEPLTIAEASVAIVIESAADKVRLGLEQRDEAVKAGAKGATTLIYVDGKLQVPGISQNLSVTNPRLAEHLFKELKLVEGDAVIICSAEDIWRAEEGALAAALKLAIINPPDEKL